MRRIGWRTALAVVLTLALVAPSAGGPAPTAHAASTFTVNSTDDERDALLGDGRCASTPSGACTLRAAIMEANALAGPDTIMVPSGTYALTQAPTSSFNDQPADGDLDITSEVTIRGASALTTLVTRDVRASSPFRLVEISPVGSANISGVSFRGGRGNSGEGGAVRNAGTLTLRDSEIRNNGADFGLGGGLHNAGTALLESVLVADNTTSYGGHGGGIYNPGSLTLRNVTVRANSAFSGAGGGLHNAGTALLENVLVTGNAASYGGGIFNPGASLMLRNVTVSANSASAFGGGGLYNTGTSYLVNVTMQGNQGPDTGRSIANVGRVEIRNSIISRTGGDNCSGVALASLGNNIESGTTCRLTGPADLSSTDSLLGPLADNGGPTATHALLAGSPAIDAGADAACPATDQRGAPRPRDGNGDGSATCDIGALELQASPTAVVCAPRPPVRVAVDRNGPNALQATITAPPPGISGGAPDRLRTLRFGRVTNATIDAGGQTGIGANQTVTLPDGISQTTFVVHRGPNGPSATVELVVVDDCGEWRTFVGGGPGAF